MQGVLHRRDTTIQSAFNAAIPGQAVVVESGSHSLSSNLFIPSDITLKIKNGASLTLNSYTVTKASTGSIVIENGVQNNPDIRLQTGSTIYGLYPTAGSALTASTTSQKVHIRGTYTNSGHLTVPSGKTLQTESGSTMRFSSNRYLYVNGTLIGNGTAFTGTSGTWGGIKYQSGSNGSISNCTINNANYGLYLYNSSPDIVSTSISNSMVYLNNSDSDLDDNYFNNYEGSSVVYLYGSSPTFFDNTIDAGDAMLAVSANNGSDPWFGGINGATNYFGYNILSATWMSDGVIWAQGGSTPMLGYGGAGPYYCGYNSIISSGFYPAAAIDGASSIDAAWCWWGQYPAPACYGDVNTADALNSDPGGGSSLDKVSAQPISVETAIQPDEGYLLWQTAMEHYRKQEYQDAVVILKNIVTTYPQSRSAYKALNLLQRIGRVHKTIKNADVIDELLSSISDHDMNASLKSKKARLYRTEGNFDESARLCRDIIKENPKSLHENYALFDLFNLYQKDLKDTVLALTVLDELKQKYPESDLTIIARIDNGEEYKFDRENLSKRQLLEEPVEPVITEFSLLPAYPNPFNPSTTFKYASPWDGIMQVEIFNVLGQCVRRFKNTNFSKGSNQLVWNGTNDLGNTVTSGIYFVRFTAESVQDKAQRFDGLTKVIFIK